VGIYSVSNFDCDLNKEVNQMVATQLFYCKVNSGFEAKKGEAKN
jgi:hypothetical protein